MRIVYACNDKYFDGLYLSILSIIRRCNKSFTFYILSGNFKEFGNSYQILSTKHLNELNRLVKKFNKKSSCHLINCTLYAKKCLSNKRNINKHFSPYANLRLLIDLFPCLKEKTLYLDTDIMACGNVEEIFRINMYDNEICVCHNWWLRNTIAKKTFNSGVILFNMSQIRKTELMSKARRLFNSKKMLWPDQTALVKSATKIMFFPDDEYRFNRQSERIHKGDILKHFCNRPHGWPFWTNIKQWDIKNVHKHLKIHEFDEDYNIWLKKKDKH